MRKLLIGLLVLCAMGSSAQAQVYFGKNKVQYTEFDWQVLTTDHFKIYFYPEERWLAEVAAFASEQAYERLRIKFDHHIYSKVPVIIYSAANYFQQTNVTESHLPESVGGFTEFFKGRVVVPFTGSYSDFVRIIKHEMVHVFTYSKLDFVLRTHNKINAVPPPLWLIEGLAEHWSRDWGTEADLILRQMVLEDRLVGIRNMERIHGSFYMYKVGESILNYWSDRFGDHKITELLENWWQGKSFAQLVENTFGVTIEELDRDWAYTMKKAYYPELEERDLPIAKAEPVSPPGFFMAPTPVCVPKNDTCERQIVYLGNRIGYSALYRQKLGETGADALIKGGRSGRFEALHLFRSGIDANDDGIVAFSSKSNERDVLYFYDLARGKVTDEREFAHLVGIVSPAFSPDGNRVVFCGAGKDGWLDLYTFDRRYQHPPQRLTSDMYRESSPVFTPDGRGIVFASDRGQHGIHGGMNLYRYDLETEAVTPLTSGKHIDATPVYLGPDTLLFVSDRGGSYDIYALVGDTAMYQVTSLSSGALDPAPDPVTGDIYFTAHTQFGYRVHAQSGDRDLWTPVDYAPPVLTEPTWQAQRLGGDTYAAVESVEEYDHDFSIDIAQSAVSYDAVFGTVGGVQVALSDMLGDEIYYFLLSNPANNGDNLLTSFNISATYLNRKHRLNFGYGAFHLYDDHFDRAEGLIQERQIGGVLYASYPLSKFRRIELTSFVRYSRKQYLTPPRMRDGLLATPTISIVHDNSLWEPTGPIDGVRANVTAGVTYFAEEGRVLNRLVMADLRHYYRLGARSALATRLYAFLSSGEEPVRRYFGGSWDFRGYPRRAFYVRRILFASNELRFPLINRLAVDFPIGRLDLSSIRGALFFDAGSAWEDGDPIWRGSWGFGWRMALGYVVTLRFDFAQTTDFHTVDPGLDFDFFFGWNF